MVCGAGGRPAHAKGQRRRHNARTGAPAAVMPRSTPATTAKRFAYTSPPQLRRVANFEAAIRYVCVCVTALSS
ncbi:unnamed protein product [Ixodes pacificus]